MMELNEYRSGSKLYVEPASLTHVIQEEGADYQRAIVQGGHTTHLVTDGLDAFAAQGFVVTDGDSSPAAKYAINPALVSSVEPVNGKVLVHFAGEYQDSVRVFEYQGIRG